MKGVIFIVVSLLRSRASKESLFITANTKGLEERDRRAHKRKRSHYYVETKVCPDCGERGLSFTRAVIGPVIARQQAHRGKASDWLEGRRHNCFSL